jgi:quercetin dioxygenase-like cupin family protein
MIAAEVPALDDSALALQTLTLEPGTSAAIGEPEDDVLLYVSAGSGLFSADGRSEPVHARSAGLVLAGEEALLHASVALDVVVMTAGPGGDRHAPMGPRALTTSLDDSGAQQATGARSFQILFGPKNGSTRATLFAGFVPPGKAPWHYHLYDEIVWLPEGPGRLHIGDAIEELGPGSAFRLRPRQLHIVENASPESNMTVIGLFTPAGSPSAAYVTSEVAAEFRVGE